MSGDTLEARQGGEAMASSGADCVEGGGGGENEGGRASSTAHGEPLMNGAGALKLEAVSADGELSSRSNKGSMRISSRGDEGSSEGATRANQRKGESEVVPGSSADTPHRPRLERSAKRGDSGTKPTDTEIDLNEGVVESSMFKQVKFENGAAITQSGLTDADDKRNALEALASVMALYGIPKEVVGRIADFPGETWFGSKQSCRVCRKPETAKHTIICDKCQGSYHLSCAKLKPKQALEIENEHWQCESCGPELGSPYWPLGRITPLHDRRLADPRVVEPINAVERRVVTLMDAADAAALSTGGDRGGRSVFETANTPTMIDQEFASFSKESILSAKRRGRGRPKRDETLLANDLGVLGRGFSEEQLALDLGNTASAPQLSAMTPELTPAPTPAVPSQMPFVGGTDTLTTTNDKVFQGDGASLQPQPMLEDLRTFIEGMNLKLEKGWEVIIKQRPSNPLVSDKIYISPDGHKFRSRLQVARFLEKPRPRTYSLSAAQRTNVQPAAQGTNVLPAPQELETSTQRADISLESLGSGRVTPFNLNVVEPKEEPVKRIEKVIPIVKENRSLPPAGVLLTKKLPTELVGDVLEIWEFLCRFSDVLDLKSPLTYEELEAGLVNLGPPASEDTISIVDVQHSSHPSSGGSLEKACAEVGRDSPHKAADRLTDPSLEGTGVTLENALNPEVQGEDLETVDSGSNRIGEEDNGPKQDMFVTGEAGALPQSTTVQKNTDLIPGPAELPGEKAPPMERSVASPDGTLNDNFVSIAKTHMPLLKLVLSDLQFRINGSLNVSKSEEPKKKGRKPLYEPPPQDIQVEVPEFSSDLPMNEVTWPEMVRRYLITLIEAEKYGDLTELKLEERRWLLRCLHGDGGVPCGALYTNLGAESDAQVLAEAEKELAVREPKDCETEEEIVRSEKLPDWVEALRPVAKMATNVGSRIRIKVKEALELGPPQWAREQLEWSISKDVFKGNASGPTKKAVVEVLNHYEVSPPCESPVHKTKVKKTLPSVDRVILRCRIVLRTLAEVDNIRAFSILIGGPEGHGSKRLRGMVSRPIDFRSIDARLAAGAYGESVEAFAEDVRQIWKNVELLQKGGDVADLATSLSRLFDDLLQNKVINFMNGTDVRAKEPKADVVNVVEAGTEPTNTPLTRSHLASVEKDEDMLQTAPWQDTQTCRVCGVDEDYESIMLCDVCDEEYHTYCLNPPLTNVPEGDWFCPQCVALDKGLSDKKDGEVVEPEGESKKFPAGKEVQGECSSQSLLKQIESKDYWQLGLSERVHLLKFLCNEAVKSTQVRAHLERSVILAFDLQQQLSNLQLEREGILKTRSHTANGTQASSVEAWSSRLRHHPSSALGAEDIGVSMPRILHFDADGKEDEHLAERINTTTAGNRDLVIRSNETVSQASAPTDRNIPLAVSDSADMLKKRKIDDVSAHETEFATQVERAEASTPERIMTRNSKRTKVEEHGEGGDPQAEDTKTVVRGSESKTDANIDPEIQMKELVGSASPGGRNTFVDESGEEGRRAALRSSHLEHPDSSGVSGKIGVAAGGLPPRTPKRRLETTSSSEISKKLRTDVTANGEGTVDGKSSLKVSKDNFVEESQSIAGTTQGIPTLGEVIDDPQGDEAVSDPIRQGSLSSTMDPESTISKLDAEIIELESKLYNTTLRRDHLGIDDVGRQYWALSGHSRLPLLVVSEFDGIGRPEFDGAKETFFSYVEQSERANSDGEILQNDHTSDRSKDSKTRWWTYNTEASIDSLMAWLNPRVKVERELRSSISCWRETASLLESNKEKLTTSCLENDTDGSLKKEQDTAKAAPKRFPTLKATSILQMRYGSSSFSDRATNKKPAMPMEGRVIRCSCLEPLWKFKWHCPACHETYESLAELESHKNVCPEGVHNSSFKKKQKGSVKGKSSLTPEKAKKTVTSEKGKKTITSEKGKKATIIEKVKKNTKAAAPKDGIKRSLEKEDIDVHNGKDSLWMSDDFTEPSRTATRGRRQTTSRPDDGVDANGDVTVADEPVDDAFFLSDFQDDVHNPGMDNAGQEDFTMNFGSFQSLLQDDEWEANLRPDRSDPKRKKHGLGKKSSKQPLTQGASEMALANFDYASLPMSFSTPDSTRDRILQIGCIADRGPTFAPALHFAPAFDPSLMIQPCYPDPNQSPTDAGEFPGSSPLQSSQNDSPIGELGGLDAVSWYDPQTSGDVKSDVVFVPDSGDVEPVVQPGSGLSTWDLAELVGLPKTEYDTLPADGGELDQEVNDETVHFRSPNTNGETQSLCTTNGEEGDVPVDKRRPDSVDLVPEALPALNVEVPLEIASAGAEIAPAGVEVATAKVEVAPAKVEVAPAKVEVAPAKAEVVPAKAEVAPAKVEEPPAIGEVPPTGAVVPPARVKTVQDMSLKKQAKKFAAPESSLRPLVGEQFGFLIGLKMRVLDMEAAMGVEALVPLKSAPPRRRVWRSLVKSAKCIYEMTKAIIILEQMVRPDCLKRTWCYWSSLSSAARSATLSTLALRVFALDAAITYKKDKVVADESLRHSSLRKPKKKIQVQSPLSSKSRRTNKAG